MRCFVLRPVMIPRLGLTIPWVKVTRRLDADGHMPMWRYRLRVLWDLLTSKLRA